MKIRISTDSTADIPEELRQQWGITALPLTLLYGEQEWQDGVTITPREFYKVLNQATTLPVTAAIPPVMYTPLFEETWEQGYTDLIHVSINGKGSSTYQNGMIARSQFYEAHPEAEENFHIHILDSATYSMGYGMAVLLAARMAAEGESVESIIAAVQDCVSNAQATFVPLDLKCVKKSGRVSPAAAFLGDALGLKPIIAFEGGEPVILSKARGEHKAMEEIISLCNKKRKPGSRYVIVVGDNDEATAQFQKMVAEKIPDPPEFTYQVGCVIALNTGPNMIGLIYRS